MRKLTVKRFLPGHVYYSDATITHQGKQYQANFGEMLDESGRHICFTLERRETLTPEGCYPFTLAWSPNNKCIVPLMDLLGPGSTGTITYESLQNKTT